MENLQRLLLSELGIPAWQLGLLVGLISFFALTHRVRAGLIATYLLTLYWNFYVFRAHLFSVASGDFLALAVFILFGFFLAGLLLYTFLSFRESSYLPGLAGFEIGRLRKTLLRRMDQMESAILQAEAKAAHEIKEFAGLRQNIETQVGPLEDHVHEMDQNLRSRQTAVEDLEGELLSRIHDLESQVSEKGELLRSRDKEIEALRSEAEEWSRKLQLQLEEAGQVGESMRGQEAPWKKAEEDFVATIRDLERQLAEKEALLIVRNREIKELHLEARERVEALDSQSRSLKAEWDRRESSFREREEKLSARVSGLEEGLREKEAQLGESHKQLQDVRSELAAKTVRLQRQLLEKARGEKSKEPLLAEIEALNGRIRELEGQVADGKDLLRADEKAATLQILLQEQDESFARRTASYQEVVESLTARIEELEKQLKENGTPAHARNGEKSRN